MKKLFYSLFALAMTAMTLTSCEDVPAPYDYPGSNPGEVTKDSSYINETFAKDFGKFEVVNTVADGYGWNISYSCAVGTGYLNKVNKASASYLVSKEIDLSKSTGAYLQFDYALGYANNDGNDKVLITSDYTGNPSTTKWTDITGKLATTTSWEFSSYKKNLSADFIGKNKVRIAFYFDAPATKSKTWEIKNVIMKDGKVDETTPDTPDTPNADSKGTGTYEDPYNVTAAIAKASAEKVWVKAYIVGRLETSPVYDAVFNATGATINTNILVAASASETDSTKCMPVQLPAGDIRGALNLVDNASNIGKEVLLYGDVATYFKLPGVKNVTYAEFGGKSIGTKPGDSGTTTSYNVDFKTGLNSWTIDNKTKPNAVENIWVNDAKYGMKATGYANKVNYDCESWLISPKLDFSSLKTLTLSIHYAVMYFTSIDVMKKQAVLMASSDGTNWTEIALSNYPTALSWTFVDATADLSAYAGKKNVQIALKYISTSAKAGTWEIETLGVK